MKNSWSSLTLISLLLWFRFLAVHNRCNGKDDTCEHIAIVSGMQSGKLYEVNLTTGGTNTMKLVSSFYLWNSARLLNTAVILQRAGQKR